MMQGSEIELFISQKYSNSSWKEKRTVWLKSFMTLYMQYLIASLNVKVYECWLIHLKNSSAYLIYSFSKLEAIVK